MIRGTTQVSLLRGCLASERIPRSAPFAPAAEGTFLMNPSSFRHAPRSKDGCELFVKLRQFSGPRRPKVLVQDWRTNPGWRSVSDGVRQLTLYDEKDYPESIRLVQLDPGHSYVLSSTQGAELFVVKGCLQVG